MALLDQLNSAASQVNNGFTIGGAAAGKFEKFFGGGTPTGEVPSKVVKDTGIAPLSEFISTVKTNGLATTNNFTFSINAPIGLINTLTDIGVEGRFLNLMCSSVDTPSLNIATNPVRYFGEIIDMPNDKNYGTIRTSFYVDANMYVKLFFDRWMDYTIDPISRQYEFYDNYVCDPLITVFDKHGFAHYAVQLKNAFPKSITSINLSHEHRGEIMKLDVEWSYRYYVSYAIENTLFDYGDAQPSTEKKEPWSKRLMAYAGKFSDYQSKFNNAVGDVTRTQSLIKTGDIGGLVGQNFGGGWF